MLAQWASVDSRSSRDVQMKNETKGLSKALGHQRRQVSMWKLLQDLKVTHHFISVTRDVPQDPQAGLQHVHQILGSRKFFPVFLLFIRSFLNLQAYWLNMSKVSDGELELGGGESLSELGKVECFQTNKTTAAHASETIQRLTFGLLHGTWQNVSDAITHSESVGDCRTLPMVRFGAVELGVAFEVVVGSVLIVSTWFLIFAYLLIPPCSESSPSCLNRSCLSPSRLFGFFILGPSASAGFSNLIFLSWLSPRMFNALFRDGEGRLWWKMWYYTIVGGPDQDAKKYDIDAEEMNTATIIRNHLMTLICLVPYVGAISFSIQQLLIKITMVDFIVERDFYSWSLPEWLRFIGFVNQLVGCFDFYPSGLSHFFTFTFGSSDACLSGEQSETACWYLKFLAMKCENDQVGQVLKKEGRMGVVSVLATINDDCLQRLLQSHSREEKVNNVLEKRHAVYARIHGSEEFGTRFWEPLAAMGKNLKSASREERQSTTAFLNREIGRRITDLEKERDQLIDQARSVKSPISGDGEASGSGLLNLAAEVQDFIEDLRGMQEQGADDFSQHSDTESETDPEE